MPDRRCKSDVVVRALAFGAAIVLAVGSAGPARAAPPDAHGYWWRLQQGVPLGPASPAPDGGLWVAADPTGPQAVSAVRFVPAGGEEAESLVLEVATSDGTAAIVACPAAGSWEPPDGAGAWADAPAGDCDTARVDGVLDEETGTWSFALAALSGAGGAVDVVLAPATGSGTFSITFAPPGDGAVATRAAAAPVPAATPPAASLPAAGPASEPTAVPAAGPEPAATAFTPPPLGSGAVPYDPDPEPLDPTPAPAGGAGTDRAAGTDPGDGSRHPLALLIAVVVGGTWLLRTRFAVAAAASHPLAAPFVGGDGRAGDTLGAEALLLAGTAPSTPDPALREEVAT